MVGLHSLLAVQNTPDLSPKCLTLTKGCEANGFGGRDGRGDMVSVYLQSIGALLSPLMMLHTAQGKKGRMGQVGFVKSNGIWKSKNRPQFLV